MNPASSIPWHQVLGEFVVVGCLVLFGFVRPLNRVSFCCKSIPRIVKFHLLDSVCLSPLGFKGNLALLEICCFVFSILLEDASKWRDWIGGLDLDLNIWLL